MIDTLFSSQTGIAIMLLGNNAKLISVHEEHPKLISKNEIAFYIDCSLSVETRKCFDEKEARKHLVAEYEKENTFFLCISLFDSSYSLGLKEEILDEITDSLGTPEVFIFVKNKILSVANLLSFEFLPSGESDHPFSKLVKKIKNTLVFQEKLVRSWDNLSSDLFQSLSEKNTIWNSIVREGTLGKLCDSVEVQSDYNSNIFSLYKKIKYPIIDSWLSMRPAYILSLNGKRNNLIEEENTPRDFCDDEEIGKKAKKRKQKSPHEAFENVKKQISTIEGLIKDGDLEKAHRFIQNLIQEQVMDSAGRVFAAKSLCNLAQRAKNFTYFDFQLSLCRWAVQVDPEDGRCHGQLGDAYLDNNFLDKALESFEDAKKWGHEAFGLGGIARVYRLTSSFDDALSILQEATVIYDDSYLLSLLADTYKDIGDYDKAISTYNKGLDKNPNDEILLVGYGNLLKFQGHFEDAQFFLEKAFQFHQKSEIAILALADLMKERKRASYALELYCLALRSNPHCIPAIIGEIEIAGLENPSKIVQLLAEQLKLYPNNLQLNCFFAESLRRDGKLERAKEIYEKIGAIYPYDARPLIGRANIQKLLGNLEDSLNDYDKAILKYPKNYFLYHGRADLLKELGYFEKALEAYDEIIRTNRFYEDQKRAISSKASIYLNIGELATADMLLKGFQSLDSKSDWFLYFLKGMLLLKKQKKTAAKRIFLKGKNEVPFAESQYLFRSGLAMIAAQDGNIKRMKELVKGYNSKMDNILTIHSYLIKNQLDKAKEVIEEKADIFNTPRLKSIKSEMFLIATTPKSNDEKLIDLEFEELMLSHTPAA